MRLGLLETVGARLVALILAIAVPLSAGMAAIAWQALEQARAIAASLLKANTNQAAHMIEDFGTQTRWVLERKVSRPAIRALSPGACAEELPALQQYGSDYLFLSLWRADGAFVCSTMPPDPARQPPRLDPTHFAEALAANGPRLSDVYIGIVADRPVVAFSHPIHDAAGRTTGIVFLVVRMAYFDRVLLSLDHRAGSAATLLDRRGTIVARVPAGETWRGRKGTDAPFIRTVMSRESGQLATPGVDGIERSVHFRTIGDTGWRIVYGIGTEQLYARFHSTLLSASILFGVVIVTSVGAALLLSRQVGRPLERLAAVADALGKGETRVRAEVTGPREVARVAVQFNRLIDTLQAQATERRLSESNLAAAQRLTHLGSWEMDLVDPVELDRNALRWSDETFRIFGFEPGEIAVSRERFLRSVHPDDRERIDAVMAQALEGVRVEGGRVYEVEHRVIRPDGSERIVREYAEMIFDEARGIHKLTGTIHDITQERHAARRLQFAHDRLRVVSHRLLRAEEAVRLRISRGLHDQVGQELTALKIVIDTLARTPDSPRVKTQLAEAAGLAGETLQRIRQISVDLRPPQLDALGVAPALRAHVLRQAALSGLSIHLDIGPMPWRTTPEVEITCFRIAQEAINNVLKHARAANAWVSLAVADEAFVLEIRDDGAGFDPDAQRQRSPFDGGLGLMGMEERVTLVGGRLDIRSTLGHGCVVVAILPCPHPPEVT